MSTRIVFSVVGIGFLPFAGPRHWRCQNRKSFPAPWASGRLLRDGRQDLKHLSEVGGLDQMVIETSFLRTLFVLYLPVAGHGDQHDATEIRLLAQPLRHLKAVDSRQTDVQQHHVWSEIE